MMGNEVTAQNIERYVWRSILDVAYSVGKGSSKRLRYHVGDTMWLVTDHDKLVYQGVDAHMAAEKYNGLGG